MEDQQRLAAALYQLRDELARKPPGCDDAEKYSKTLAGGINERY